MSDLLAWDLALGESLLVGCDEVGRGALAGPVYAAAVSIRDLRALLNEADWVSLVNDSKQLTAKLRAELMPKIQAHSSWAIGEASVAEIDSLGILGASLLAMNRAIGGLNLAGAALALIDGRQVLPSISSNYRQRAVVRGDSLSFHIACASIIAKQARDLYMSSEADLAHPNYCFSRHKGYGTKLHCERIRAYGGSEMHRVKFLRKLEASPNRS